MRLVRAGASATALVALFVGATRLDAQAYFGQNQVQYDHFKWTVTETEHFLVHYYPEERVAAMDAARMAERAYARLSRLLNHQFREKKPLILYSSRGDFGQNNVTGDLGEGTGGVTEALRHRMLLPFTGDYKSFEHVLAHEMVHAFQYDIFARGRAGAGLQTLAQVDPPLWFMEGMAEYLAGGPNHILTQAWVRDAALNGHLPTIEQMTVRPDQYFPYRYGEALWEYVGNRWGDEIIGEVLNSAPNVGIERAFKRETGLSLEDLSDEWREAMQTKHLPQVAQLERARKFSQALLNERRSGGSLFLAPSLSSDGKYIAFVSLGSFLKGEVFPDLWLGDGETGRRIKRLVKSTTDPNYEELRLLYSQSSFSPDGKSLAFTAQREGRDVLYLMDVRRRKVTHRFDLPLEGVTSPSWSPDGRQLVFSGAKGGITDLFVVDRDGRNLRRLTNDRNGDNQPQWSPDGKTIAFVSDRGPQTDFDNLKFSRWEVSLYDLETGRISVLPGQSGQNLNPMWAPDGKSVAFVSDRTGIPNIFIYDLDKKEHYQITNVVGAVLAVTEYSPVITWARQADRLAFAYYENGDYSVWSVNNPRRLMKEPYRDSTMLKTQTVARAPARADSAASRNTEPGLPNVIVSSTPRSALPPDSTTKTVVPTDTSALAPRITANRDSVARDRSIYRSSTGLRASADLPSAPERAETVVSVAQLLDSAAIALPDTTTFKSYGYKIGSQPEYISRPSIGYAQDNFGRGVFGGTTIVLSDLLGDHRLAFAGQVNGRLSEAYLLAAFTSMGNRTQYTVGGLQTPIWYLTGDGLNQLENGLYEQTQAITRFITRQAFGIGAYPLNRFTRIEFGGSLNSVERLTAWYSRLINVEQGLAEPFTVPDSIVNRSGITYGAPYIAYVSDNTLFGYTGPIAGRRYRFQIEPTLGSYRWIEYQADYRRYFPILFNFLTLAGRAQTSISVGRDETALQKYIGRPEFVRGYDREEYGVPCAIVPGTPSSAPERQGCSAIQLLGSRVAFANAELRFPLVRRFDLGLLPISLPPVDGLFFYDIGLAWSSGQDVSWKRESSSDVAAARSPVRSYGAGIRLNLFGFALLRWDYAIALDRPGGKKGYWTWTLGPSF
jgi:Tol biopolymer transport system component